MIASYSYVAFDGQSTITREQISPEALAMHYGNLVVCGYRVTVTDDNTRRELTNDDVVQVQTDVQRAKYGRGPLA